MLSREKKEEYIEANEYAKVMSLEMIFSDGFLRSAQACGSSTHPDDGYDTDKNCDTGKPYLITNTIRFYNIDNDSQYFDAICELTMGKDDGERGAEKYKNYFVLKIMKIKENKNY